MLSGILMKTSFSFFSKLSVCCFSYFVSKFTFTTTSSRASLSFFVTCNSVASILARDCTSSVTLTCSFYNAFVVIFANTNCTYAKYLSGVWVMTSSTCNILVVIWKLGLSCVMVWMMFVSFCVVLSFVSVTGGIIFVPLSCLYTSFICPNTSLI
jgi:hypothetical protein